MPQKDKLISNGERAKYFQELWEKRYNWENCALNRQGFGEFIASYVTQEPKNLVLNLNGAWGTGKSEFLKRLYTEIRNREYACVYIDAWESDFSEDPLLAVISELTEQLGQLHNHLKGSLDSLLIPFGKLFKSSAAATSTLLTGDPTAGYVTANFITDAKSLSERHQNKIQALYGIKNDLTRLAVKLEQKGFKDKIIVLIDELDRCRPDYAIELLEVIKHFFDIPNFSFVIATDTEQLSHSIKAVYGEQFESKKYLERFFDRSATLPEPNIEEYLSAKKIGFNTPHCEYVELIPQIEDTQFVRQYIALLCAAYKLELRMIDQLLAKAEAITRAAESHGEKTQQKQLINLVILLVGLIHYNRDPSTTFGASDSDALWRNVINNVSPQHFTHTPPQCFIRLNVIPLQHAETPGTSNNLIKADQAFTDMNAEFGRILNIPQSPPKTRALIAEIRDKTTEYLRENTEYYHTWQWNEYKTAIELAGYLE